MAAWKDDELRRISDADELRIAPVRRNGELRCPSTIWAVARAVVRESHVTDGAAVRKGAQRQIAGEMADEAELVHGGSSLPGGASMG